jgi:hypothetical protein
VQSLGGAKIVGAKLYPDKSPDRAAQQLLDCLNAGRPEKLELGQVLMILRMARDAGHHGAMQWLAGEVGYEARPVTRAEEMDHVTAVVEQAAKVMAAGLATIERLQRVRAAARPASAPTPWPARSSSRRAASG